MKILAIGDFHGSFPKKFERIIKKEKIDAIISVGDYLPFHYRKLWFKHCFGKEIELWEIIGKTKYKKLVLEDLDRGEEVLKRLNKLPVRVFTVMGNVDYPLANDVSDYHIKKKGARWDWAEKSYLFFSRRMKKYKNIRRIDYTFVRFGGYVFIGMRGHSFPGKPGSKGFRKHKKKLDRLFREFMKENGERKVIFVSHTPPFNTRLDKLSMKARKEVRGKHFGSKMTRRVIEQHQPLLNLCGHTHERWGVDKIRKTTCVNVGAVHEGKGAVIELPEGRGGKMRVRFIK